MFYIYIGRCSRKLKDFQGSKHVNMFSLLPQKKKVKYFQEKDVSKDFRDTGVGTYNKGKCLTF